MDVVSMARSRGLNASQWFPARMCRRDEFSEGLQRLAERMEATVTPETVQELIGDAEVVDVRSVLGPSAAEARFRAGLAAKRSGAAILTTMLARLRRELGDDDDVSARALARAAEASGAPPVQWRSLLEIMGPTLADVRSYCWQLRGELLAARKRRIGAPFEAWEKAKPKKTRELAFRRALAGCDDHGLSDAELGAFFRSFQVLGDHEASVVDALADLYVESGPGRLEVARTNNRDAVRDRKRRELFATEQSDGAVSSELWRLYVRSRPRPPFDAWLRDYVETCKNRIVKVQEWATRKNDLAKRLEADAKRVAPTALVDKQVRDLASLCESRVGDHLEPSRKGLNIEQRLSRLKGSDVVTRRDVDAALGPAAFSLLADAKAASRAKTLTDLSLRDALGVDDDIFVDSLHEAQHKADQLKKDQRADADCAYDRWRAAKAKAIADDRERQRAAMTTLDQLTKAAKRDASRALRSWRKAQRLVGKRHRALTATTSDEDPACAQLDAALAARRDKAHQATEACARWRHLQAQLKRQRQIAPQHQIEHQ